MGIGSGVVGHHRNHLRGHHFFGSGMMGRGPPFMMAALFLCLFILLVSYWHQSSQFANMKVQLDRMILKKDSLEANERFISKQLELREENFSEAKVSLQRKEQETEELKSKLDSKQQELTLIQANLNQLKLDNGKLKFDLKTKQTNIEQLLLENGNLKRENLRINEQIKELNSKLLLASAAPGSVLAPGLPEAIVAKLNKVVDNPGQSGEDIGNVVNLVPVGSSLNNLNPSKNLSNSLNKDSKYNLLNSNSNLAVPPMVVVPVANSDERSSLSGAALANGQLNDNRFEKMKNLKLPIVISQNEPNSSPDIREDTAVVVDDRVKNLINEDDNDNRKKTDDVGAKLSEFNRNNPDIADNSNILNPGEVPSDPGNAKVAPPILSLDNNNNNNNDDGAKDFDDNENDAIVVKDNVSGGGRGGDHQQHQGPNLLLNNNLV